MPRRSPADPAPEKGTTPSGRAKRPALSEREKALHDLIRRQPLSTVTIEDVDAEVQRRRAGNV